MIFGSFQDLQETINKISKTGFWSSFSTATKKEINHQVIVRQKQGGLIFQKFLCGELLVILFHSIE